jgi:hypothetical protein
VKRRPRRSIPAVLTALIVLAACTLVAVVAIQIIVGQRPWVSFSVVAGALHATHWNDLIPAISGGVAAFLGLLLVLAAVLPGKPTILPLGGDDTAVRSGAARRSLRSTLRAAASTVDGVSSASLVLRPRKVTAIVRSDRTNTSDIADAVRTAIDHRLDQIAPARRPKVTIRVHAARSQP